MAYRDLLEFVSTLDKNDELHRIGVEVNSRFEISEINDRIIKTGGKALFFEKVLNSTFPVLINAMGNKRRLELALGVDDISDIGKRIHSLFEEVTKPRESFIDKLKVLPNLKILSSWMPQRKKSLGDCQRNILSSGGLDQLPILTTWPFDGGPFITFPVVHTVSLEGKHNMGMYRMQKIDSHTTAMHWHLHKGGANHFQDYKKAGKRMPVTVTLGGDPSYTYAATAPLPEEIDEYILAGFLRNKAVTLVKCQTNDIFIPDDVDFVLEGYVDPSEDLFYEGPFGDHTGYYSLADFYPKFHITHITHKNNAIFPATVVGIPPQEDAFIGLATERMFLAPIKLTMVPEIVDMHMPMEGVFHNLVITSIDKKYQGQSQKVMNALWGAGQMMFNKYLIVTDKDQNLLDYSSLFKRILQSFDPLEDVLFSKGPLDVLDHASSKYAIGGKMGIDATKLSDDKENFVAVKGKEIALIPGVLDLNLYFVKQSIGLLIIKAKKSKNICRNIAKQIVNHKLVSGVKLIVFVEEVANIDDFGDLVWRVANNSDPNRDCFYIQDINGQNFPLLFMDGLRKNLQDDGFERDWPNIVTMNLETIKMVDERWIEYGFDQFVESPSRKYIAQLYGGEAIAHD